MSALTILICCYNAGGLLKKCLDSLIAQDAPSSQYKIVFVDDASTDGSFKKAQEYAKQLENFTIIKNKQNRGLVDSCNRALSVIDTPYFMRLDADDYLSGDAVRRISEELGSSAGEDFVVFKKWDVWNKSIKKVETGNDIYTWIASGTVFNTHAVRSVGGYSDEYWEEYDLYIKLSEAGYRYRISPYHIYHYRRGHGSMTQDREKNKKGFESLAKKWNSEILNKYGNLRKILEYYQIKEQANAPH